MSVNMIAARRRSARSMENSTEGGVGDQPISFASRADTSAARVRCLANLRVGNPLKSSEFRVPTCGDPGFDRTYGNGRIQAIPAVACDITCTPTEEPETSCEDGVDNDCDGLVDGGDPDCGGPPVCGGNKATCSSGADCCSGNCDNRRGMCRGN